MKIVGFTQIDGVTEMLLKSDSCLLVNRKPFFTPDGTTDIRMTPCVVLRVSRLGKSIDRRFAERYYDAVAPGIDFVDQAQLDAARQNRTSWTKAIDFDYSLAVGEWTDKESMCANDLVIGCAQAIEEVSRLMTIRQGDLIYIDSRIPARSVKRDEVIEGPEWAKEQLYCKIK